MGVRKKRLGRGKILMVSLLFLLSFGLATFAVILNDLPKPEQLATRQIAQSTKIYDRSGSVLLYEIHGEEKRTTILLEEIPPAVKQATIAIEESNFYNNPGFDWRGILRAIITNVLSREFAQGGSTITQQLARNAFLSSEKTIIRKIKELLVAIELERQYSKDEILGLYLNQIPYGGNAYGIEAASQTFFGKPAKELSLAEAALLASLPRATSYYSPWGTHLEELMKRKNYVLGRMLELGYISEKEKRDAQSFKLSFVPQTTSLKAPHFVLETQEYLNQKYGEAFVRTAGLAVITTLNWDFQQIAETAALEGANRNSELYDGHNSALVAQDATTGQILAMVGSKDYFGKPEPENCAPGKDCQFEGNFNVATQGLRQPGSAIKPLAYITAFKNGFTPQTVVFDLPTEFAADEPDCPLVNIDFSKETPAPEEKCFHPQNFDGRFRGPVTLKTALAQSINIPAVKTLYLAGIDETLALAQNFGITTLTERSRYGLSLVLGGGEVILKDLIGAYSIFAQEGIKHKQAIILKVTDAKGNVLEEYKDAPTKVIDPQYPRLINEILTDLDERAGLFSSSLSLTIFPGHQVALKTGTTNDYRDAWAIGYAPDLVVGVWAGNNDNTPMKQRGSSILAAVPIWSAFMKEALKAKPLVSFNNPDPVVTSKPILNGEPVVNYKIGNQLLPQIHSVLYYVDKKNPQGPPPANPEKDSQFQNWEQPVLRWAEQNIPNFLLNFNHPLPSGTQLESKGFNAEIAIEILAPKNGEFIKGGNIVVQAKIKSQLDISKVQLSFNNELVDERLNNLGKEVIYQFNFLPKKLELQNSLKLKAMAGLDNEQEKEIILFK